MNLESKYPVLLLPVKIETRYVSVIGVSYNKHLELWVRIFPDQAFLSSFNPILTVSERKDRVLFKKDSSIDNWQVLVEKYGQYRASWIIHISEDDLSAQQSDPPMNHSASFFLRWLPDSFKIYLSWRDGAAEKEIIHDLNPIQDLDGLAFSVEADNWFFDFQKAQEKGLATRIVVPKIESDERVKGDYVKHFKRIIAVGIRREESDTSTAHVRDLLKSHQYTSSFSFVNYGTPTNNLKGEVSGHASGARYNARESYIRAKDGVPVQVPERDLEDGFLKEQVGQYPVSHKTNAEKFSAAMGFEATDFKHNKHADGAESRLFGLVRKATWFALGGQMLRMLFGNHISNEAHEQLWKFYSEYVDPKGPLPTIKLGKLPYGILPVVHLSELLRPDRQNDAILHGNTQDKINLVLAKLYKEWLAMAEAKRPFDQDFVGFDQEEDNYVPRMTDVKDSYIGWESELKRVLSMEPHSTSYAIRLTELSRIPAWYHNLTATPQSIRTYAAPLVHKLLEKKDGYDHLFEKTEKNVTELVDLFYSFFHNEENAEYTEQIDGILRHAPVFSLEGLELSPWGLESFKRSDHSEEPLLPLSFDDDWYATHYKEFLEELVNGDKENLVWYKGELSILVDLLLRSYVQALKLYYRDVYYYPTTKHLDGVLEHRVIFVEEANSGRIIEKGALIAEIAAGSEGEVKLHAPFTGTIEKTYYKGTDTYEAGQVLSNDLRIVRMKDEQGLQQMKAEMISIGAQIISAIQDLKKDGGKDHLAIQQQALAEVFDLNSHRLDAWLTAIATQRLDWLREGAPADEDMPDPQKSGLYIGAYGWVEDLQMNKEVVAYKEKDNEFASSDFYDAKGGIIHCPTPAQAVTSAMFRQSFSTYVHESEDETGTEAEVPLGNPFTINLTSDRIQKSKQFLEGIRQGQDIKALLGYRFERFLHDNQCDQFIHPLRRAFPLTVNKAEVATLANGEREVEGFPDLTVVNGLALLDTTPANPDIQGILQDEKVQEGIKMVANILDGSADLLFYEAGFHMTQGSFSQAAAAMDAAKGIIEPPQIQAMNSRYPGTSLVHKLAMIFEPPSQTLSDPKSNPRAFLEPVLEQWLLGILGPLKAIACTVWLFDQEGTRLGDPVELSLVDLQLGALDFLQLSHTILEEENDASELEQRIMRAVEKDSDVDLPQEIRYKITRPEKGESIHDALEIMKGVQALLRESKYLKAEDIASDEEANRVVDEESGKTAITPLFSHLEELADRIAACIKDLDTADDLDQYARYAIQNAGGSLFRADVGKALERCRKEAKKVVRDATKQLKEYKAKVKKALEGELQFTFSAQLSELQDIAKALFGKSFYLIPPLKVSTGFQKAIRADQAVLVGKADQQLSPYTIGGQERIRHWIIGRADVDQQAKAFSNFLMFGEIWRSHPEQDAYINPYLNDWSFQVAQHLPSEAKAFPWVALDTQEITSINRELEGKGYPDNAQAIVVYAPAGTDWKAELQYGLMVDHFSEFIPRKTVDTGLAFEYNAPNNEPPHAFLLAVALDENFWEEEKLKDIVQDSIDLAKVRMVDPKAMRGFSNVLPMNYWFHIPNMT